MEAEKKVKLFYCVFLFFITGFSVPSFTGSLDNGRIKEGAAYYVSLLLTA